MNKLYKFYDIDIIPIILKRFEIQEIIVSGVPDSLVLNEIFEYCENNNAQNILIDSESDFDNDFIKDYTLNVLPNLKNYDAVFLNDDPNWYAVFNELNIMKEMNDEFPLVFICHSVFPYKRRDAYIDPEIIPEEFRNDYSDWFEFNQINIQDGFYHAIKDNTPKNGVLTAVEDFLSDNPDIGILNIKFINGIIILYQKSDVNQIRLIELEQELVNVSSEVNELLDSQFENKLLKNYITNFNVPIEDINSLKELKEYLDDKDRIIRDYEYKIGISDEKINSKTIEINSINSKLSLKDSQIDNFKSQLVNKDNEITSLNLKLENVNSEVASLSSKLDEKENKYQDRQLNLNKNLSIANDQIVSLKENIKQKEANFLVRERNLTNELKDKDNELSSVKMQVNDLTVSNNDLKSLVSKKDDDISSLKNRISVIDEESNHKSNQINYLNRSIQNKDNEINEQKSELNSMKQQYITQASQSETDKYCISCFKEKIENNHLEIQYLKQNSFIKKVLNPFSYLFLILKSKPKELSLNYKLYKAMKNSDCFDIGYYLNNNKDLLESKWCKYFSPELHYVCQGFAENRKFNKKYFNRNSKKELLDYILSCKS